MLVAALAAGVGLGAGVSYLQPELFSATSTGYVVAGNSSSIGDAFAGSNLAAEKASTYLPLVQSRSVAEGVAQELGVTSDQVSLTATSSGVIFKVTAIASSPQLATDMADAAIRATSIAANDLETMTISGEGSGATVVRIVPVEMAQTPTQPTSPDWTRNLALGLALGLLGGFGFVVLRHTMDRRVRLASAVEEITGVSALGVVPAVPELGKKAGTSKNLGVAAEALRKLRTNLRFVSIDSPPRVIVVTSANEGEGKSTIAMQLAVLLAESGEPTVLVDADLRRPRVAKLFNVDGAIGLTQVLTGSLLVGEALVQPSQVNLELLPAGSIPPNPSELVGSKRMQNLITSLGESKMVVIDAPPLLPVTDAGLLSASADGALLVVQYGKTRKEQVALAARNLVNVNATLLGFVMNRVPKKDVGTAVYGYGSTHPYTYYGEESRRLQSSQEVAHVPVWSGQPRRPATAARAAVSEVESDNS